MAPSLFGTGRIAYQTFGGSERLLPELRSWSSGSHFFVQGRRHPQTATDGPSLDTAIHTSAGSLGVTAAQARSEAFPDVALDLQMRGTCYEERTSSALVLEGPADFVVSRRATRATHLQLQRTHSTTTAVRTSKGMIMMARILSVTLSLL